MTAIIPFKFESSEVRIIDRDGEPWFVLRDVCVVLDIANVGNVADRLDADEKSSVRLTDGTSPLGGNPNITIINESGLWSVVVRSDKPNAKSFRKWLTSEVIPSIRKTGGYQLKPLTPAEQLLAIVQLSVDQERRLGVVETKADRALELATIAEAKHQASTLPSQDYSVMAWGNLQGFKLPLKIANMLGRRCAAMSKLRGIPMGETPDPRFGLVNTYMAEVLEEVFDAYDEETRP